MTPDSHQCEAHSGWPVWASGANRAAREPSVRLVQVETLDLPGREPVAVHVVALAWHSDRTDKRRDRRGARADLSGAAEEGPCRVRNHSRVPGSARSARAMPGRHGCVVHELGVPPVLVRCSLAYRFTTCSSLTARSMLLERSMVADPDTAPVQLMSYRAVAVTVVAPWVL